MKRNKKFYKEKELRKISRKLSRLYNNSSEPSQYGRWNGYEFYLSVKKEAKKHHFRRDLCRVLRYCSKTITQTPGGGFYNPKWTDETCKRFDGIVYSLLLTFETTEYFQSKVPPEYRYLFDYEKTWIWEQDVDTSGWRKVDWHLADRYIKFLEVHRRKAWERVWSYGKEYQEARNLEEKINRDNLWPKINKACGIRTKGSWEREEEEIQDNKLKRIAIRQMEEDIIDIEPQDFDIANMSRIESLLLSARGIFRLRKNEKWNT